MSRLLIAFSAASGAAGMVLVDSAVKGTAMLLAAGAAVLLLRRDSAATRHFVWMLGFIALLAAPLLSAALPQWRIAPVAARAIVVGAPQRPLAQAAKTIAPLPEVEPIREDVSPAASPTRQPVEPAAATIAPTAADWNFPAVAVGVWALGCGLLLTRLLVARLLLGRTERAAVRTNDARLKQSLEACCEELGVGREVDLLIHSERTIPVVWGILRSRLLLPTEAVQWSDEKLRSVLLHELAHVRRRDPEVQLMVQTACALHWFSPLVWFAAWRLGVERERACDDLVLAGGVRPSAYAGHLLDIVSRHVPNKAAHVCGLAMARQSSLEGRLVAVLSSGNRRRAVPRLLAIVAFCLAAGVAVPIAMIHAKEPAPAAAKEPAVAPPTTAAKLPASLLENLQWGPTEKGLRAAAIRTKALGEPQPDDIFDFRIVVQNVSNAPVRLSTAEAPRATHLLVRKDGRILFSLSDKGPPLEATLQPKETTVLHPFSSDHKGKSITGDDPTMTFSIETTIEKAPAGAWSGKLVTGDAAALFTAHGVLPKNREARLLYAKWNAMARSNGKIPGGALLPLRNSIDRFIQLNPTWPTVPQLTKLRGRLPSDSVDLAAEEALGFLNELATLQDTPIGMALDDERQQIVSHGLPLPAELANAPWGDREANGLRLAWLLEPAAAEHRIGTPLKARILVHNDGPKPVVFRSRTWHQVGHRVSDAKGAEVSSASTSWTTRGILTPFRLAPGEYVELRGPGVGVGANTDPEDWRNTRVGTWIEAKPGEEISLSTDPVPLSDWNQTLDKGAAEKWLLDFVKGRLIRRWPMPEEKDERLRLMYQVSMEVFGNPASNEVNEAIAAYRDGRDLEPLARLMIEKFAVVPFVGSLKSGDTKFRVLPADPEAANRPRTAFGPGEYPLGADVVFKATRRPIGERIVNEASFRFPNGKAPFEVKLPDDYDTWTAAWMRGGTTVWLRDATGLRMYDLSDPVAVRETTVAEDALPPAVREALRPKPVLTTGGESPRPTGRPATGS